jgi:hypothetical protein
VKPAHGRTKVIKKIAQKASRKIVQNEISKHIRQSPAEAFSLAWKRLLSRPLYRLFIRLSQDSVREGTRLKGRTYELLSAGIPGFSPSAPIKISPSLQQAIESRRPFLVAHIHDGFYFISRIFADRGREETRIVADPTGYIRRLRHLQVDLSRIHAIKDDVLSLAHLRKAVRAKHVLCCAIDYSDGTGRRAYLNPAIFVFANRSGIPVYFIKGHVHDDGSAEVISAGPYVDVDPVACARKLLDFFNSVGESRAALKIKRYNEHRDWKKYFKYRRKKTESPSSLSLD